MTALPDPIALVLTWGLCALILGLGLRWWVRDRARAMVALG